MLEEFGYLGAEKAKEVVITNTNIIADMIENISPVRPDKCPPVIENSDEQLRKICYDKAKSLFESGCKKYKSRNDLRGCLDDFRLSLELLLKEILHNERTLDNQLITLNQYLAEKGVSSEISNGFRHFLDCYNKYQNNHVKHNLNIAKNDATIIIEQTKSLINILMKLKGE